MFFDVTATRALLDKVVATNRQLEAAYEELQSTNEELDTAKEELQKAGIIKDAKQEPVELATEGTVTSQTEEALLKQLEEVLRQDKLAIPAEGTSIVTITAPNEVPMFKIIRLMDYCNKYGLGLSLQAVQR